MIDWQRLVLELRTAGIPCRRADKLIGTHQDYVAKLSRGEIREPKYSDGVRLIDLHKRICGEQRTMELKL